MFDVQSNEIAWVAESFFLPIGGERGHPMEEECLTAITTRRRLLCTKTLALSKRRSYRDGGPVGHGHLTSG
jgi:hypothetical protein